MTMKLLKGTARRSPGEMQQPGTVQNKTAAQDLIRLRDRETNQESVEQSIDSSGLLANTFVEACDHFSHFFFRRKCEGNHKFIRHRSGQIVLPRAEQRHIGGARREHDLLF